MIRREHGRGQATLETALVLPLLVLVLLAVVQLGVIVAAQVRTTGAAREGARAAAVGDSAAVPVVRLLGAGAQVETTASGVNVEVEVVFRQPTSVPLVGVLFGDVTLRASATMRIESGG